ncbi:MAG: LLM class F420-dependent oxidoreductase [Acidimicrobiia bacterium]
MKVDGRLEMNMKKTEAQAKAYEALGYSGLWSFEVTHDPFLPLAIASQGTTRVDLGTSIAVAFSRSPMTVAQAAHDIQAASDGRMCLGLGSQIKPHIEKRFSMQWSHPAKRMREFIAAMRAIWACWDDGAKLDFRGDFYQHTLMTPNFMPSPNPAGPPKVFLAGVGELMTQVAGELADGFICHGFTTDRYIREVTLPALVEGRRRAGKTMDGFEVMVPASIATGENDEQLERSIASARQSVSFYGSTPAYYPVFELHGWNDLGPELNALSKQGRWDDMKVAIPDEVLNAFTVVAEPEAIAGEIARRYGDSVQRLSFSMPDGGDPERWRSVISSLRSI